MISNVYDPNPVEDRNRLVATDVGLPPVHGTLPGASQAVDEIARRPPDLVISYNATELQPDNSARPRSQLPEEHPSHDRIENTEIVHREAGWFLVSQEEPGRWTEVAGPLPTREDVRLIQRRASQCEGRHEWVVYSTALREGWLMLQCVECGAEGTIDAPSKKELSAAAHAPSRPYRWKDGTRVMATGFAAPLVIRAVDGRRCECRSQRSLPAIRGYERVPGGIWMHEDRLTEAEKAELNELAEFVGQSDLCSRLLPHFIRCCETETGRPHSKATHTLMDRIERWDTKGIHCSPSALAKIAREYAAWNSRWHGAWEEAVPSGAYPSGLAPASGPS